MSEYGKQQTAARTAGGVLEAWRRQADSVRARFVAALGVRGGLDPAKTRALVDELNPLLGGAAATDRDPAGAALVDASDLGETIAVLRPIILEQVSRDLKRPLAGEEIERLHRAIDEAAAERYAEWVDRRLGLYRAESEGQARYMSFLSHDLRGSLNGVVLMLEVMRREMTAASEAPEKIQDLDLLRRSLQDTVALIERHVLADRVRRGRVVPSERDTRLDDLLKKIIVRASTEAAERHVNIEMDTSRANVVHTDSELLDPLLGELVANAVRHSRGPHVQLIAESHDHEWSVAVVDRGPEDKVSRICSFLDPIERLNLKERGLGLTLAHDLSRLLGGRISVQRDDGKTIVRLIVPVSVTAPDRVAS